MLERPEVINTLEQKRETTTTRHNNALQFCMSIWILQSGVARPAGCLIPLKYIHPKYKKKSLVIKFKKAEEGQDFNFTSLHKCREQLINRPCAAEAVL